MRTYNTDRQRKYEHVCGLRAILSTWYDAEVRNVRLNEGIPLDRDYIENLKCRLKAAELRLRNGL